MTGRAVGGKAASWQHLRMSGVRVPDGFAVAFDRQLAPGCLEEELASLRDRTGATTVAVRSSGLGEDGAERALAGLFESFLDVPAAEPEVLAAVERCRALGGSARARSAAGAEVLMGVLVQEMLHPSCSGVLFTSDPLGEQSGMVVEAVRGHLAKLVDGTGDACRWMLTPGSTSPEQFPEIDPAALLSLGRRVEALLGQPADIEWAIVDGALIVLQARPITGLVAATERGLDLVPVSPEQVERLPTVVRQHDKIALRLAAAELGVGISHGLVALASRPTEAHLEAAARALAGWGEFIAVLLSPFDLDGAIFRRFGTGPTALADLRGFVDQVGKRHERFAFLLKELQPTASTGVAVRLPDGRVHAELVHGHFVTKGFADPTIYTLDPDGCVLSHQPGRQRLAMQLQDGKTVRVPVQAAIRATERQLAEICHAASCLADRYPGAGVEFGFTPTGGFFLVDLYQSAATTPPDRADVLSAGRVVGRIRILDLPDSAVEASIERHVHSRRAATRSGDQEPEILVIRRPLHVLDQLIYEAGPGTLGFICEGGALLCHLAVVMREHGVPGLIVPDALDGFNDGERIVLDTRPGSASAVTRL
ncbi:MAG: hypothetical protein H6742_00780 [Alphaproteobacteria bacterium]|nr:hypothetical protein [Alphaproteobacteria bacterium]